MYLLHSAWVAMGLYHICVLAAVVLWRSRTSDDSCGGKRPVVPRWIFFTPAVYACGGIAFYALWPYLNPDVGAISIRLASFGITRHTWPYVAIYFCIVNSIVEELFWRGWLRDDRRRPVLNDVLFAGYHAFVLVAFTGLVWTLPVLVACAFAGWLWRMLRSTSGGLAIPILTHFVADVGIVVAVHFRAFA